MTDVFCAAASRAEQAQLCGTATEVSVWLLLEHRAPWGRNAYADSDLPVAVRAHLDAALAALPRSRLQLIKQEGSGNRSAVIFAIAISDDRGPRLHQFELDTVDDLCALDIPGIARGEAGAESHRITGPWFLICTNARRDRCCALRGLPVYRQLATLAGEAVWRTSHLGGHRFAATGVILPHGLMLGWLDDVDLATLLRETRAGRLYLQALRGRSSYPPAAQAAEVFLRQQTGEMGIDAFWLERIDEAHSPQSTARFRDAFGTAHVIRLERQAASRPIMASCGGQPDPAETYQLIDYTTGPP